VLKQDVDDVVADFCFPCNMTFIIARNPYFFNACKNLAKLGKVSLPLNSKKIKTTLLRR
jgi:hypothetical protein